MSAGRMNPRKRVAIISQGLGRIEPPQAYGSIAIWTYETSRHLTQDYSVLMLELDEHASRTRRLEHEGAAYLYVPGAVNRVLNKAHRILAKLRRLFLTREQQLRRPEYASVCNNFGYILQAAWHTRQWRPDIIHIHNFSQFVPVVRAFNPKAEIVLHMNCEWLSQHDSKMIASRLQYADTIICCSNHVRGRLLERFPHLRGKSHVVFNGSNVERFLPSANVAAQSHQQMRMLFVGRISPEKGVHLLVEAFAKVAAEFPNVCLDVVGGAGSLPPEFLVALSHDPLVRKLESFYQSDYLAEIKKRIPEELRDRIIFHGNVGHEELAAHYHRATVFVCPSFSDAFPLTVVEAMAAGLPVVASKVGGIPEAVVHERTGLLVEPDNTEALASALGWVLRNPDLRRRMSSETRERALQMFSWRAISAQLAKVYAGARRWKSVPRHS